MPASLDRWSGFSGFSTVRLPTNPAGSPPSAEAAGTGVDGWYFIPLCILPRNHAMRNPIENDRETRAFVVLTNVNHKEYNYGVL